jgi:hypothetical protein
MTARGPYLRRVREAVHLGAFLDARFVDADGNEAEVKVSRAQLLWSPSTMALLVFDGYELSAPAAVEQSSEATALYERWTDGRPAERERQLSIPRVPGKRWQQLGRALTIAYRSDKFGDRGQTTDYQHEFGRSVVLFCRRDDNHAVLAWRGGTLRVTRRGIEG